MVPMFARSEFGRVRSESRASTARYASVEGVSVSVRGVATVWSGGAVGLIGLGGQYGVVRDAKGDKEQGTLKRDEDDSV